MYNHPRLLAVATASPPHRFDQSETLAVARRVFGDRLRDFERLAPVFANAAIERRHGVRPLEWYERHHDWTERAAVFQESATSLLEDVSHRVLEKAGLHPEDIDVIVCANTTGIATPSLEALLIEPVGFRPDVVRLPIFGLGCAGGTLGLARAGDMARAMPGRTVLFLVVELCTLAFRPNESTATQMVAAALFGDGAAAAVLRVPVDGESPSRTPESAPLLLASGEHTWPGTRGVMGWRVENDGLGVVFSQSIPKLVTERFGPVVDSFLSREGLTRGDLAGVICHPGGVKVLQALDAVLNPATDGLKDAWAVLRDHGNMSAASVMFVLERRLDSRARGLHLMTALGPGFTAALTLLSL